MLLPGGELYNTTAGQMIEKREEETGPNSNGQRQKSRVPLDKMVCTLVASEEGLSLKMGTHNHSVGA